MSLSEEISIYWDSIDSSTLSNIAFYCHRENQSSLKLGKLEVYFKKSNSLYIYKDVPLQKIIGMMVSSSPGSYFANEIKNNYEFIKHN